MKPFFALCRFWLVLFCCAAAGPALAQRFEWGRLLETTPPPAKDLEYFDATPDRSATDAHGSTYVTGTFTRTLTLGDSTLTSSWGHAQAYVAKFDSAGSLAWAVLMRAGTGDAQGSALVLDASAQPAVLIESPDSSLQVSGQVVAGHQVLVRLTTRGGLVSAISVVVPMYPRMEEGVRLQRMRFAQGNFYFEFKSMLLGINVCTILKTDLTGRVMFGDKFDGGFSLQDHKLLSLHVTHTGQLLLSIAGVLFNQQTQRVIRRDSTGNYWAIYPSAVNDIQEDAQGNLYFLEDYQNRVLVTKCTADGLVLWQEEVLTTTASRLFEPNPNKEQALYVTPTGEVTVLATYRGMARSGSFMLPVADSADLAILQLDADGQTRHVLTGGGLGEDVGWLINADGHGNLYLYGTTRSTTAFGGLLATAAPMPSTGRGFLVKINGRRAQVSGRVYLDANANSRRDPGEVSFGLPVRVTDALTGQNTLTNPATGAYTWLADTGRYQLQLSVPAHYTLTQGAGGYSGHLTSYGQVDTARHFGLAPVANQPDLRVTLTPFAPARRNRSLRYRALVENVGTTAISSGQLRVQLDPAATLVSTTPVASQQVGPSVQWDFQQLDPRQSRTFDFVLTLPTSLPLGAPVRTTVAVTPLAGDLVPADNADSLRQTVVGSFDPNDLAVNYDTLTLAQVQQGTPLDYIIRFQNLGTDTAFSVLVVDTLPSRYLQMRTLRVIGQSHTAVVALVGDVLQVQFSNIGLPHKAVDSLGSQGFVRFRVTPRATLTPGTLIPNRAHIYFDFNPPVATNAVTTLILGVTGLPRETTTAGLSVYPNPATSQVKLSAELVTAGTVRVQLRDALGRVARRQQLVAPAGALHYALDLAGVTPGLYVVQLTLPDGHTTAQRLVVAQ